MMSSCMKKLLIFLLPLFLLIISSANAATVYYYDAAGNLTGSSSSPSVLTNLTLSGNPNLTYNGSPFTFDLTTLSLSGTDQYGQPYVITGQTVTWTVTSGPANVLGSTLTITNSGQVGVTASIGTITSNSLTFTVAKATSALTSLNLSGNPSLVYNNTPLTYNLNNLSLSGSDQYGQPYSITGQTVTWTVTSGPATVSGSTLTITNYGQVKETASIGTVNSNILTLTVYQALAPPSNFNQTGTTASQISVSWSSETDASSYNLYQNGSYLTNVTETNYTYTGLSVGTSYTLAVCALDSSGNPGSQASMTAYTLTAVPTVSITSVNNSSIQVSWNYLYGASYYNAYIWNESSWVLNNSNIKTTSYTFSGLTSGTAYTLGIAGVNAAGLSGMVGQNSITTNGTLTFTTPGTYTFTVPAVGVTQVTAIICGGGGGGGGSNVYYSTGGGGGSGGTAISQVSVAAGQQYTVVVGAGGAGGISNGANGQNGGNSSFSGNGINIIGYGGHGGIGGSSSNDGVGGAGGSTSGATFSASQSGLPRLSDYYYDGGQYGSSIFGNSGTYTGMYGWSGYSSGPGCGGAGGGRSGNGNFGSAGVNGQVILVFWCTPHDSQTLSSTGTSTFTVPAGVTQLYTFVCGGGGGGGGSNMYNTTGGGGGSGGTAISQVSVAAGQQYTVVVGAGGAGGISNGANGQNGGNSSFSGNGINIIGYGGHGGIGGSSSNDGVGGAGGSTSGATFSASQSGLPRLSDYYYDGGQYGSSIFGNSGTYTGMYGWSGYSSGPGCGGAGGGRSGNGNFGSAGVNGQVVVWW